VCGCFLGSVDGLVHIVFEPERKFGKGFRSPGSKLSILRFEAEVRLPAMKRPSRKAASLPVVR
jgi:hypothetical protein